MLVVMDGFCPGRFLTEFPEVRIVPGHLAQQRAESSEESTPKILFPAQLVARWTKTFPEGYSSWTRILGA